MFKQAVVGSNGTFIVTATDTTLVAFIHVGASIQTSLRRTGKQGATTG